jgi:AraC-like DNA-binding protein
MAIAFQDQDIEHAGQRRRGLDSILFSRVASFRFSGGEGRLRTELVRLGHAGLRIGRVTSTGHRIALTEESDLTLLMPQRGVLGVGAGRHHWAATAGATLALRPGSRDTRVTAPGDGPFRAYLLMLPFRHLEARTMFEEPGSGFLDGRIGQLLETPEGRRLRDYLYFLVDDLIRHRDAPPSARVTASIQALIDDLVVDLASRVPADASTDDLPDVGADRVRKAREILAARAAEPVSIAEVASELGIGLRSLQVAFRRVHGIAPREMLNRIRLANAREKLLSGDPAVDVTTVALDSGFAHLSRFADAYRRAFGELPRETLRRARRS